MSNYRAKENITVSRLALLILNIRWCNSEGGNNSILYLKETENQK